MVWTSHKIRKNIKLLFKLLFISYYPWSEQLFTVGREAGPALHHSQSQADVFSRKRMPSQ